MTQRVTGSLVHYKFENKRNIIHTINSIIQYVNNVTDMHVIYYVSFKLVAYRISYNDFAVLCAKIGVETTMTDNMG